MKIMMYIMPFMIIGFGIVLPAALTLYWVVGNIISIIQNLLFINLGIRRKKNLLNQEERKNESITQTAPTKEEAYHYCT